MLIKFVNCRTIWRGGDRGKHTLSPMMPMSACDELQANMEAVDPLATTFRALF